MQRIGLIGVGNVGSGFAKKLREAGYPLTVHDRDPGRMEAAVALGAKAAETPGQVADESDIILLSLPGSHVVEAVMAEPEGVADHLRAGQVVVDTGTSRPQTAVHYEKVCRGKRAGFIDAPITGRSQGWIMMVGGAAEHFERARQVLECLSYKLKHVGPIGHGQVLKLMNQLVLAGQQATYAETIAFMEKAGMDPRLLSEYLEFSVPEAMYGHDFGTSGTLALHYKDLGYILELAHDVEASIPLASMIHEFFKGAKVAGEPGWWQAGVVEYWRKLNRTYPDAPR
jgi:3-hydroxyisobutyrate dehydrogenase-like beta-hydroxyacid dehydrogenase